MNRREFALAATSTVIASTFPLFSAFSEEGVDIVEGQIFEGQIFYLDRPLRITYRNHLIIRNCQFIANPGFQGKNLIEWRGNGPVSLTNNFFDWRNIG